MVYNTPSLLKSTQTMKKKQYVSRVNCETKLATWNYNLIENYQIKK